MPKTSKKDRQARLERAKEIMGLHLPPGSMALSLGRLGFGGWAMSPEQMRAEDRREREAARVSAATAIHRDEGDDVSGEDLCSNGGCFDAAAFLVIPTGRWAKTPPRKACKACAKPMAAAFETKGGGEPGSAVLQKLQKTPKAKTKPKAKPVRSKRDLAPPESGQ